MNKASKAKLIAVALALFTAAVAAHLIRRHLAKKKRMLKH